MQHLTTPDPTATGSAASGYHTDPAVPPPSSTSQAPALGRRSVLAGGAVAAAASVTLLSSCGSGNAADIPLTFWNFYSPAPQQDPNLVAQSEWFQTAIDRWNTTNQRQIAPPLHDRGPDGPADAGGLRLG